MHAMACQLLLAASAGSTVRGTPDDDAVAAAGCNFRYLNLPNVCSALLSSFDIYWCIMIDRIGSIDSITLYIGVGHAQPDPETDRHMHCRHHMEASYRCHDLLSDAAPVRCKYACGEGRSQVPEVGFVCRSSS
jgi:hypothetical protein